MALICRPRGQVLGRGLTADPLRAVGLTAGYYWPKFKDAPHAELEDDAPAVAPKPQPGTPPAPQVNGAWTPPVLGDDEEISIAQDPRVNATHKAGVLPCPKNPPPPTGWKYWKAKIPKGGTALAVSIRDDQATYPMGSFVQTRLQGKLIAARVEWHPQQGSTGKKGCFRGGNLSGARVIGRAHSEVGSGAECVGPILDDR